MSKVKILGTEVFYRQVNPSRKKTILFVHAHPCNHDMWRYQIPAFKNYCLIIPDLIGYGQTQLPSGTIYVSEQALCLRLLLDNLTVDQVHLVGLSMGGEIITEFARLFPEMTLSLAICANIPRGENPKSAKQRVEAADEMEKIGMEEFTRMYIHRFINIKTHPPGSQVYRHLEKMMEQAPASGAAAYTRGRAVRRDNLHFLQQLNKKVLVIAGEKDNFFSPAEMGKMAALLPHPEYHYLPNCGHMVNMENAEVFNKILLGFINSIESRENS